MVHFVYVRRVSQRVLDSGLLFALALAGYGTVVFPLTPVMAQTTCVQGVNCSTNDTNCSLSNPCLNGGNCTGTSDNYTCSCVQGFTGQNCSININDCEPNPCQNGGTCSDLVSGYNCTCLAGYTGTNCSIDVDECESGPCKNGGNCTDLLNDYNCTCVAGYTGKNCSIDINDCEPNPCTNGGNCTDLVNGYNCTCAAGYSGTNCSIDIDECALLDNSTGCQNGGLCVDGVNQFTCNCTTGYEGTLCQNDTDECAKGLHNCHNYADCINTVGSYNCSCRRGYEGDGRNCKVIDKCKPSNPCLNGGHCENHVTSYNCECAKGWKGVNCTEDIDECSGNNPCAADADCLNTNGSYTCTCKTGFRGDGKVCTEKILYPFDLESSFRSDDDVYTLSLKYGLPFMGKLYKKVHISMNGYISLDQPIQMKVPIEEKFPPSVAMIAPYWADIDTSQGNGSLIIEGLDAQNSTGTKRDELLSIQNDVRMYSNNSAFTASEVLLLTWNNVPPFPAATYKNSETVTFQVVLATDHYQSYVIFNYDIGLMRWNPSSDERYILIGYSDGNQMSHVLTSAPYSVDQSSNINRTGRYFYSLGPAITNENLGCQKWFNDKRRDLYRQHGQAMFNMSMLQPCPCTSDQAKEDIRFTYNETSVCATSIFQKGGMKQKCCYNRISGSLNVGYPNGGYPVQSNDTEEAFRLCCIQAKQCPLFYKIYPSDTCIRYKPHSYSLLWGDPHLVTPDGFSYTFNGLGEYVLTQTVDMSFQGRMAPIANVLTGQANATVFTAFAAKISTSDKIELRVKNQNDISVAVVNTNGRTVTSLSNWTADLTDLNNVAVQKKGDDQLLVLFANGFGYKVKVGNSVLSLAVSLPAPGEMDSSLISGLLGVYDGNKSNDLVTRIGTVLNNIDELSEEEIFQFGQTWMLTQANESLFTYSLDGPGKSFSDYNQPDFKPIFYADLIRNMNFTNMNESNASFNVSAAREICGDEKACLVDFVATGNAEVAKQTKALQQDASKVKRTLDNFPPLISVTCISNCQQTSPLRITAGVNVTLNVNAKGENVKIMVNTNLPLGLYQTSSDAQGNLTVILNPSKTLRNSSAYIQFIAMNALNATRVFWPEVHFCSCENMGDCSFNYMNDVDFISRSDRFYEGECKCSSGWTGKYCGQEFDVCGSSKPCFKDVNCTMQANRSFVCGACPTGMIGDGKKCADINECVDGTADCQQTCVNTQQSYFCKCAGGYQLQPDKKLCKEIDECTADTHSCKGEGQYCVNTAGSHKCQCMGGYYQNGTVCKKAAYQFGTELSFEKARDTSGNLISWETHSAELSDPKSAVYKNMATVVQNLVNEALVPLQPQGFLGSQHAEFREGSITAAVNVYFAYSSSSKINASIITNTLKKDLKLKCPPAPQDCRIGTLIGINVEKSFAKVKDLCLSDSDNNCDKQSTNCSSLDDGTFKCTCKSGFLPSPKHSFICEDIDECEDGTASCNNSRCSNTPGSYKCLCNPGFVYRDSKCVDVCLNNPCKNGGTCQSLKTGNSTNNYQCKCAWKWKGHNCEEDNEEAINYQNIAIGVGVGLGVLCLILILVVVFICCFTRKKAHSRKFSNGSGIDSWDPAVIPCAHVRSSPSDVEMVDRTSKQNLLDHDEPQIRDPNQQPITSFGSGAGQGIANPAYSAEQRPSSQPALSNSGNQQSKDYF